MTDRLFITTLYYWVYYREISGKIGKTLVEFEEDDNNLNILAQEISYYIFFFMSLFLVLLLFMPILLIFNVLLYYFLKRKFKLLLENYTNYSDLKNQTYDYIIINNVSEYKIRILCNLNIIIFALAFIRGLLNLHFGILGYK